MANALFGNQTRDLEAASTLLYQLDSCLCLIKPFIYSFLFCLCEVRGPLRTHKTHCLCLKDPMRSKYVF